MRHVGLPCTPIANAYVSLQTRCSACVRLPVSLPPRTSCAKIARWCPHSFTNPVLSTLWMALYWLTARCALTICNASRLWAVVLFPLVVRGLSYGRLCARTAGPGHILVSWSGPVDQLTNTCTAHRVSITSRRDCCCSSYSLSISKR